MNIKKDMSEHTHQSTLMTWAAWNTVKYPQLELLYAIPNSGITNAIRGKHFNDEGRKSGIPDICLPCKSANGLYNALYIELKIKGGKLTESQKIMIEKLNAAGNHACVCYGWTEARDKILQYLGAS